MGTSTFSGPLQAGTVRQGPYENIAPVELSAILPVTVNAALTTDVGVVYLPAGATVTVIQVFTGTAFTGATVTLSAGSALGGAQYVSVNDIKAAGTVSCTFVTSGLGTYATAASGLMNIAADTTATAANNGIPTAAIYFRVTQTATTTAVGAATIVVKYTQNP
jgi:hypothetical protein